MLILSGELEAVIWAAQLAAARLALAGAAGNGSRGSTTLSRADSRSILRAESRSGLASRADSRMSAPSRADSRSPSVAPSGDSSSAHCAAGGPHVPVLGTGSLGFRLTGALGMQSPNEAALLKAVLVDSDPQQSQLTVLLPLDVVHRVFVPEGHFRSVEERSGSSITLGSHHAPSRTQLVTISGTRLGNSMAALYLQELLAQHGVGAAGNEVTARSTNGSMRAISPSKKLSRTSLSSESTTTP